MNRLPKDMGDDRKSTPVILITQGTQERRDFNSQPLTSNSHSRPVRRRACIPLPNFRRSSPIPVSRTQPRSFRARCDYGELQETKLLAASLRSLLLAHENERPWPRRHYRNGRASEEFRSSLLRRTARAGSPAWPWLLPLVRGGENCRSRWWNTRGCNGGGKGLVADERARRGVVGRN